MIKLIWKGGAGGHTVSALLDYCTEEGNIEGYPNFDSGNHLHPHLTFRKTVKSLNFYDMSLHDQYTIPGQKQIYPNNLIDILAPIANDDLGKLLIFTMDLGKASNKKLPPNDDVIDYQNADTVPTKIEKISMMILGYALLSDFVEFHGHQYPDYPFDVLWFYHNDYDKIIDIIENCGWTPKIEKVKEFCNRVLKFNKPYYDIVSNCSQIYNDIISKKSRPCELTLYETSMVHALLMKYYHVKSPSQVKCITTLPKSTEEFFNLYDIT